LSLRGYEGQDYDEQIYVNKPLRAGNLKIYQSSWGWMVQLNETGPATSAIINLKNYDTYVLDESQALEVRVVFIPDYAEDGQGIYSQSPLPNNPRLGLTLLRGDQIIDVAVIAPGQEAALGAYKIAFQNFAYYSGLLIKEDPGVKIVFVGFGLLLLGLLGRYGRLFFAAEGE
jgi:cytochrome c biogenesis protein